MRTRDAIGATAKLTAGLILALVVAVAPASADDPWKFKWSNGFKLDSPDGKFKLKFGGRIQYDLSFASVDDEIEALLGPVEDGNEFRRARLFFSGTIYENVEFKAQYDFAGGETEAKDVYVGLKKTAIGGIRVGHFKEPFSIEEQTSSKYIAFLERSLPNVFSPSRNTGIMIHNKVGDRFTWAGGVFRESDDFGFFQGDGYNVTGRITGLPLYNDKGRQLFHVGVSASRKDYDGRSVRFRQRPEAHISPRYVNTGSFAVDTATILDLELAFVAGPFWALAEYITADFDAPAVNDPTLDGFYVQAGFYLTGEHRRYKTSTGAFDRQKPKKNFGKEGAGAWEIAFRYSTLDLTDEGVAGGELDDLTVALNWYLNPATRWMLNYVKADLDGSGEGDYILMRFQVDF